MVRPVLTHFILGRSIQVENTYPFFPAAGLNSNGTPLLKKEST
jgi:hypothetical protein